MTPQSSTLLQLPKVLVVDDSPVSVGIIAGSIAPLAQIYVASSGDMALSLAYQQLPDLILLDIEMPDLDGLAVCQALKTNRATQDIPIIFVTGESHPDY